MIEINLSNLDAETLAKLLDRAYWLLDLNTTDNENRVLRTTSDQIKKLLENLGVEEE